MSGGGGDASGEIRYAPYLEDAHKELLGEGGLEEYNVFGLVRDAMTGNLPGKVNPFGAHDAIDISRGFFGVLEGDPNITYELDSFPSLFDMYGKFMGGLDVCDLWGKIYENLAHGPEIAATVAAHSAVLQDDIDTTIMPKFLAGMRDINAIQSTAFVVGKGLISASHVRGVNDFQAKIRQGTLQLSGAIWEKHLTWNTEVIKTYGDFFKLYHATKLDTDKAQLGYQAKDILWDLGVMDHARMAIGAMSGQAATTGGGGEDSGGGALGGAMGGAAAGFMVAGPVGALIGGVLGAAASLL